MAYATKEFNLVAPNVGTDQGGSLFTYVNSADDTLITLRGADFVADGADKGLKVGDLVITKDNTGAGAVLSVSAVTAGGAATLA